MAIKIGFCEGKDLSGEENCPLGANFYIKNLLRAGE